MLVSSLAVLPPRESCQPGDRGLGGAATGQRLGEPRERCCSQASAPGQGQKQNLASSIYLASHDGHFPSVSLLWFGGSKT